MERERGRLHRSLAVLAAPKRFQLLLLVRSGKDRSVSQLARAVRLSQSCTTRHLQALEAAGLVKGWRDGKRVVFRLEPRDEEAAAVIASLEGGAGGTHPVTAPGPEPDVARPPATSFELEGQEIASRAAALGAIAVASTAELETPSAAATESLEEPAPAAPPRVRRRRREPSHRTPRRRSSEAPAREEPESGMNSAPPPAPRYWSEIEDYLL